MEEDKLPSPGSVAAGGREESVQLLLDIAAAVEAVGGAGAGAADSTVGERRAEVAVPDGRCWEKLSCKLLRYSQSSCWQEYGAGEDPI